MLEYIKFVDHKVKAIKIRSDWFVSAHHISNALGVSSDTLKGIVRHYMSQQYKFSRKEINIDKSYNSSKLFTTIPEVCRIILCSTHPDRYDPLDFLVEKQNHVQDQVREAQKTEHVALDNNIPAAKNYREHIYFEFKLGEPELLGSNRIAYGYDCISRYPRHMKNGIKNFREKHPGSIIILKIVNNYLRVWKENHSKTMFRCYFLSSKGPKHILLVDDDKNDNNQGKVTEAT